jgi:formylglycine-generating enzyme required for sulfatase activity
MPKRYDVFLSYNNKEKLAVREIGLALEARGLRVWLDEWELIPGLPWHETLQKVIQTVNAAAVLIGRDGLGPWEGLEVPELVSQFIKRRLPVIPVLLPGVPREPALPWILTSFPWVDLREGLSQVGIDMLVRGIKQRRSRARSAAARPRATAAAEDLAWREHPQRGAAPALDRPPVPGETFTEPLTGLRFLWIPGGSFQMGGNEHSDEQPVHPVRVSPFWMSDTPVTNRQYALFLEGTGAEEPDYWLDRRFSAPTQPVVGVSWEDAQSACSWLSEVSGLSVMLPSEAQWEFAARGTDGRGYPWGNDPPDETRACFNRDRPAPVGSYPAGRGPFGALDQAGNVNEWCRDNWDQNTYARMAREGEPVDPVVEVAEEQRRVLRGGGWADPAESLRAAYRLWGPAWRRHGAVGFRVIAEVSCKDRAS